MSELPVNEQQTARYVEKREAILDAAARLFNRRGMRGTTLSDVAQSVGLVTNSVTYYYRKKEALALACSMRAIATFQELLTNAEKAGDPNERIRALVVGYFRVLAEIEAGERAEIVNFNDIAALSATLPDLATAYADIFRRVRGLIRPERHINLSRAETNARAHLLLALTQWGRVWLSRYEASGYMRAAEQVSDILLQGLGATRSGWAPLALPALGDPKPADDQVSQDSFLRAATRLINEQGFRGASVEKISASLNVTKGSFYHHNDNKDDLIVACFERTFAVIRRTQAAAEGCGSGWQKLSSAAAALVSYQLCDRGPLLRITARSGLSEIAVEETLRTMNRLSERFANFVVDGIADGSIRPVDPAVAAHMVNGMVNASASMKRWVPGATIDNAVDLYARPLFMGLLSRGA